MCVICLEWQKGKLTDKEALRAFAEMANLDPNEAKPDYHYYEMIDKILDKDETFDTEE